MAALRLTEKGYRVGGPRGRPPLRRTTSSPKNSWDVRQLPVGAAARPATASSGSTCWATCWCSPAPGVGGGSLNYANTLYVPPKAFFDDPQWRTSPTGQEELAPYYDQAQRDARRAAQPDDDALRRPSARRPPSEMGVGDTFHMTPVGVFFGDGRTRDGAAKAASRARAVDDPYFGGAGPRPQGVHRVRRVHDGLPARRQEHPQRELPRTWPSRRGAVVHPMTHRRRRAPAGRRRAATAVTPCTTDRTGAWAPATGATVTAARSCSRPAPTAPRRCCTAARVRATARHCPSGSAS